ncbi:MAG TPA: hypothetical protein VMV57_14305 [Terracidiphilus sp.]|nr:hypothetical protein [Terracidiphilus sp.]
MPPAHNRLTAPQPPGFVYAGCAKLGSAMQLHIAIPEPTAVDIEYNQRALPH